MIRRFHVCRGYKSDAETFTVTGRTKKFIIFTDKKGKKFKRKFDIWNNIEFVSIGGYDNNSPTLMAYNVNKIRLGSIVKNKHSGAIGLVTNIIDSKRINVIIPNKIKEKTWALSSCIPYHEQLFVCFYSGKSFTGTKAEILEHLHKFKDQNVFDSIVIQFENSKIPENLADLIFDYDEISYIDSISS